MRHLIWLLPIVIVSLYIFAFSTAGDGWFRYPCQDPLNWEDKVCLHPICDADGTCTEYLIERTDYEK